MVGFAVRFLFASISSDGPRGCESRTRSCIRSGATNLVDLEVSVVPRAGRAFLFNHHLLHEGARVTKGLKYVLRSDLMYRRDAATRG